MGEPPAPKVEPRVHFKDCDDLCSYIRSISCDTVILAFSNGKDSVASWLQLRKHFRRVIPVYREIAPGLRFIEESLTYYEQVFGERIYRYPDPALNFRLHSLVYQPPCRRQPLFSAVFTRKFHSLHIYDDVREIEGVDKAWVGYGWRAADNVNRRWLLAQKGPTTPHEMAFCPVFDWNIDRLRTEIRDAGVRLPVDYAMWSRSFDSFRAAFLPALKKHYPDDYEKLLRWFPLLELDLLRRQYAAEEA